jgi:dolichyl-phosphate beta-glucosyltransferase
MKWSASPSDQVSTGPRISFVLPCFNEGARIASSLSTVESWFAGAEILVVDDGSADDTVERAQRYASSRPGIGVHRLPQHRGKGAALRAAIPLVRGELVVFMDADLAFGRESVERALNALTHADIAVGNRRDRDSYYSVPVRLFGFLYRRHLTGLLFNAFVRWLVGVKSFDTQCGLKAFRRACLESMAPALSIDGFALDVEMLVVAGALGAQIAAVPVRVRYETPKSTVGFLPSAPSVLSDLFRIVVRRALGRYARGRLHALAAASALKRSGAEAVRKPL